MTTILSLHFHSVSVHPLRNPTAISSYGVASYKGNTSLPSNVFPVTQSQFTHGPWPHHYQQNRPLAHTRTAAIPGAPPSLPSATRARPCSLPWEETVFLYWTSHKPTLSGNSIFSPDQFFKSFPLQTQGRNCDSRKETGRCTWGQSSPKLTSVKPLVKLLLKHKANLTAHKHLRSSFLLHTILLSHPDHPRTFAELVQPQMQPGPRSTSNTHWARHRGRCQSLRSAEQEQR